MMTDLCNIEESQYQPVTPAIGPAEECWIALGIDKHRVNYGDYRNDLEPNKVTGIGPLKFHIGRKFVDVGRVNIGLAPDTLARQIVEYQQSTWATGGISQNDNIDSLSVIMGLAAEYRHELEAAARQEGIHAAMEMGLIDADKCEQFNRWLDAQVPDRDAIRFCICGCEMKVRKDGVSALCAGGHISTWDAKSGGWIEPESMEQEQGGNGAGEPATSSGNGGKKKKPPRKHYANARRPVPDEALHALRQHPWNEHRLACELLYALGIRAEELLDLRRGDFEKRPGYVWVNRRKGGEQPWLPLLDKLMHPELQAHLDTWIVALEPGAPLFTLKYPALYQWARRNLKVGLHMFRHNIAKRLDEAGCNPRQIQAWLGHKSLQTTMGYLNPSIEGIARKLNNGNSTQGT